MSKNRPTSGGRLKKSTSVSLVRSSAAEYLTFVAAGGNSEASVEMRYEDENIWLTHGMGLAKSRVPRCNNTTLGKCRSLSGRAGGDHALGICSEVVRRRSTWPTAYRGNESSSTVVASYPGSFTFSRAGDPV
jgi:hypothetical protein